MRSLFAALLLAACATSPDPVTDALCQDAASVVYGACERENCTDEARKGRYGLRACELYCYRQSKKEQRECEEESE